MSEQTSFPFPMDDTALRTFLTEYIEIEKEQDRLRDQQHDLVETYKELLPLRWIRTAVKVLRARRKLAEHPKEPLALEDQDTLEALVEHHLDALDAETRLEDYTP